MKKVVFAIALVTVVMSCGNSNTSTSTPVDSTVKPVDTPVFIPDTVKVDTLKAL